MWAIKFQDQSRWRGSAGAYRDDGLKRGRSGCQLGDSDLPPGHASAANQLRRMLC